MHPAVDLREAAAGAEAPLLFRVERGPFDFAQGRLSRAALPRSHQRSPVVAALGCVDSHPSKGARRVGAAGRAPRFARRDGRGGRPYTWSV